MQKKMDPRVTALIEAVRALENDGGAYVVFDGKKMLVRVQEDLIPKKWPKGVTFEPLADPIIPPIDSLLTVKQAVEYAHQLGATSMTKWDVHKDIKGVTKVGEDGKLKTIRGDKYKLGVDAFRYGDQYFLRPDAVKRRVEERLENARRLRPKKAKAPQYDVMDPNAEPLF